MELTTRSWQHYVRNITNKLALYSCWEKMASFHLKFLTSLVFTGHILPSLVLNESNQILGIINFEPPC